MSDADVRRWPSHERTRVAYQQGWENAIETARAWQALRDFLDGTADTWRALFYMGTD